MATRCFFATGELGGEVIDAGLGGPLDEFAGAVDDGVVAVANEGGR